MKRLRSYFADNRPYIFLSIAIFAVIAWLMLYRLGSLVGGISSSEYVVNVTPMGWNGIYHNALYLPLKVVRSFDFYFFPHHGQILLRLPNAFFGAISIISFTWLIWLWHGRRTALIAGSLFATGAWTLHVSRLASFDVLYLSVLPLLLLMNVALQRRPDRAMIVYGNIILWGLLIYIPGAVWLVIINAFFQRKAVAQGWQHFNRWWQRSLYVLAGAIWLPLLINNFRSSGLLRIWLGLPTHLETPFHSLKNFAAVFVHLFIRGPEYPGLWLGKAPILDIFTLAMCVIGLYFYARHPKAARTRLLGSLFLAGAVLVALGGPVGLSLLVPLMYVVAATGITYLLKEWLQVFPLNPLARGVGLSLVAVALIMACTYNLRAYFIAWPHNKTTQTTFRRRL